MKNIFGSHFVYTKNQRNGIIFLIVLIVLLQVAIHSIPDTTETYNLNTPEVRAMQHKLDSLKLLAIDNRKPRIFPFNPNFISDYKGYQLGMSVEEIDRLHVFRAKNKYVNSSEEFQQVTKISDSLLDRISPYFKFPDWVSKRKKKKREKRTFNHQVEKEKTLVSTNDINLATLTDFLAVDGVDEELSERIIKYRTKLQGFSFTDQIYEVWGMERSTGEKLLETFNVISSPKIEKININTATFKEVLRLPYIDYELCVKIFDYRDEVAELQSIEELKNIEGFPMDKYDRIVVYLHSQ